MKRFMIAVAVIFIATAIGLEAQTTEVITSGLMFPNKVITAGDKWLLVAEAGNTEVNTGRISLVNRNAGNRKTLIGGLPSGVNNLGGAPAPSGAQGIVLVGRTLYVAISSGDSVQNVGPGLESPNPNPSSRIYGSVLKITLPRGFDNLGGAFQLSPQNHETLANGGTANLTNAGGQKMSVRVLANLPNYIAEPRDNAPDNVRSSNLYGLEFFQKQLYVVDASLNRITRIDASTGEYRTFVKFASQPNPMFPALGGPVIEAVPDNVRRWGNQLIVPLLSGFPFVEGLSEVRTVRMDSGK